jgi:hypothetical protein
VSVRGVFSKKRGFVMKMFNYLACITLICFYFAGKHQSSIER